MSTAWESLSGANQGSHTFGLPRGYRPAAHGATNASASSQYVLRALS